MVVQTRSSARKFTGPPARSPHDIIFGREAASLNSGNHFRWKQDHKAIFRNFINQGKDANKDRDFAGLLAELNLDGYQDIKTETKESVHSLIAVKVRRKIGTTITEMATAKVEDTKARKLPPPPPTPPPAAPASFSPSSHYSECHTHVPDSQFNMTAQNSIPPSSYYYERGARAPEPLPHTPFTEYFDSGNARVPMPLPNLHAYANTHAQYNNSGMHFPFQPAQPARGGPQPPIVPHSPREEEYKPRINNDRYNFEPFTARLPRESAPGHRRADEATRSEVSTPTSSRTTQSGHASATIYNAAAELMDDKHKAMIRNLLGSQQYNRLMLLLNLMNEEMDEMDMRQAEERRFKRDY